MSSSPEPVDAPVAPAVAPPRPSFATRITERLPEILIEALFMLIAVVLAFAVEEWREERELDHQAGEAREAILQEVRNNRDELLESQPDLVNVIAALEAALAADPGSAAAATPSLSIEIVLLSSAAWRAAQQTEASRRMDYGWMLRVSQTYELQALHQTAQAAVIDAIVTQRALGSLSADPVAARVLLARLQSLKRLDADLQEDYARLL